MKRKSLIINIFILFSLLYISQVTAQVTIGAGLEPRKGLLLDLKENNALNKESNASKGFGLPRIALTSPTTLTIDDDSKKSDYVGVVVYNIGTNPVEGTYSWDGTKWVSLSYQGLGTSLDYWDINGNSGTNATTNFLGTTDSVALAFRVNNKPAGYISNIPMGNLAYGINSNPANTGVLNIAIGRNSLNANTTGWLNIGIGEQTLEKNTTGQSNLAIGYSSLGQNTTGRDNVAIGSNVLNKSVTASGNTAVGRSALQNTSGQQNTAVGYDALGSNDTGTANTAIGWNSGVGILNGNNNIFIGANTRLPNGSENQMNIGNLVFGSGMTGSYSNPAGNMGVGTSTPESSAILELKAADKGFLPPRVALTSSTDVTTITSPATGLLIYNTGAGSLSAAGYYYWNGEAWARLEAGGGVVRNITIVTGSRTSSNPYIVQVIDYYIFIRLTGTISGNISLGSTAPFLNTNFNIQLPDPVLNPGRELYLINDSYGVTGTSSTTRNAYTNYPIFGKALNTTGNYSAPGTLADYTGSYTLSVAYSKIKIVSDGARWICINIDVV